MPSSYLFGCTCGQFQGHIRRPCLAIRAVCYCTDCQAYAHYLNADTPYLTAAGGTPVCVVQPENIVLTQGLNCLTYLSLSETGNYRFFTRCCNTPICNMARSAKTVHLSFIQACIATPLNGPQLPVKIASALRVPPSTAGWVKAWLMAKYAFAVAKSWLSQGYRLNPFINAANQGPQGVRHKVDTLRLKRAREWVVRRLKPNN